MTARLRGLVFGDFHLGCHARYALPTTTLTAYLKDIVRKHAPKDVPHIFLLGDIFDTPTPSQSDVIAFFDFLLYCTKAGKTVDILAGNHCRGEKGVFSLATLKWLTEASDVAPGVTVHDVVCTTTRSTVPVCFLPWPHKEGKTNAVNFAHILKNGTVLDTGKVIKDADSPVDDLYWFIGDNHTPQRVKNSVWPGTPYQTRRSETLPRFVVTFEATTKPLKVITEWHEVQPPYELVSETVTTTAQATKLLRRLESSKTPVFGAVTLAAQDGSDLAQLPWPSTLEVLYAPLYATDAPSSVAKAVRQGKAQEPPPDENHAVLRAVRRVMASKKLDPLLAARAVNRLETFFKG
jgi:hypothetical protein